MTTLLQIKSEIKFFPEMNRFPSVVERSLRSKLTQTINVFNGGVSGNNSMHSTLNFIAKAVPLSPDFVVLMHNMNDLGIL